MKYLRPLKLEEASSLVANGGIPLSGGTVLVPKISKGTEEDYTIVDISKIAKLKEIYKKETTFHIGSTVTMSQIIANKELNSTLPAITRAASMIGHPQIRNMATLGGNIAYGTNLADFPPILLALDSKIVLNSSKEETVKSIEEIISQGLQNGELITAVHIPIKSGWCSNFIKYVWRKSSGNTIVSIGLSLELNNNNILSTRVAIGGICYKSMRLADTEKMLSGNILNEKLIEKVSRNAASEVLCDIKDSPGENYRRNLVNAGVEQLLNGMVNNETK